MAMWPQVARTDSYTRSSASHVSGHASSIRSSVCCSCSAAARSTCLSAAEEKDCPSLTGCASRTCSATGTSWLPAVGSRAAGGRPAGCAARRCGARRWRIRWRPPTAGMCGEPPWHAQAAQAASAAL
eukprot:scaffold38071_cov107-Isochrysis_galbana.AAC.3